MKDERLEIAKHVFPFIVQNWQATKPEGVLLRDSAVRAFEYADALLTEYRKRYGGENPN